MKVLMDWHQGVSQLDCWASYLSPTYQLYGSVFGTKGSQLIEVLNRVWPFACCKLTSSMHSSQG